MCVDEPLKDSKSFEGKESVALLLIIQIRKIKIQDGEKTGCIGNLP